MGRESDKDIQGREGMQGLAGQSKEFASYSRCKQKPLDGLGRGQL